VREFISRRRRSRERSRRYSSGMDAGPASVRRLEHGVIDRLTGGFANALFKLAYRYCCDPGCCLFSSSRTGCAADWRSNQRHYYPAFGSNCCGDVSFSSTSFTVGPAVETVLNFGGTHINFDFDASSLTIAFLGSTTPRSDPTGAFNCPSFTDATGDFGSISSSLAAPWAQCR